MSRQQQKYDYARPYGGYDVRPHDRLNGTAARTLEQGLDQRPCRSHDVATQMLSWSGGAAYITSGLAGHTMLDSRNIDVLCTSGNAARTVGCRKCVGAAKPLC